MEIQDSFKSAKSFWIAERILFTGTLATFLLFTLLLMWTERDNHASHFLTNLFNIVSVGTLTGLFRGDSGLLSHSSQFVLLLDMIVNGLIASFVSILLIVFVRLGFAGGNMRTQIEKIGAHTKGIIAFIFLDFLFIWGLGTALLWAFGAHSLWEATFNSASHILNDGVTALPNNMVPYARNAGMLLSGALLITIGGLGIGIRGRAYRWLFRKVGLRRIARGIPESVLVPRNFIVAILVVTVGLQALGALSMFAFEAHNNALFSGAWSPMGKLLDTYYMSVSARTAGFTVFPDLMALHDKSHLLLMVLMSIGAASGSFAGGVLKLTAFMYLFVLIGARFRGTLEVSTARRFLHFAQRTVIEANFRIIGFTTILAMLILVLFFVQPNISGLWLTFESISAVSNTGLTLGATSLLNPVGMVIIILLMTVGKIGFLSAVISFFPRYQRVIETAPTDEESLPVD